MLKTSFCKSITTRAAQFASAVRKQVQAIDPDEPISDVKTMDKVLGSTLGQRWLTTLLVASFAGVAALLAVIGSTELSRIRWRKELRSSGFEARWERSRVTFSGLY